MKKVFNSLFLIASLLILSVGCKFYSQQTEESPSSTEKVRISVSTKFDDNSRKAYVDSETLVTYYKQLKYTLTATDSNQNTLTVFEEKAFEDLINYSGEFDIGTWTFTMSAFDSNLKNQVLTGVCTVELSKTNSILEFNMTSAEGVTGKVEVKVFYNLSYAMEIEGVKTTPEITLSYRTITKNGLSEPKAFENLEEISIGKKDSDNIFVNIYEVELPVEKYIVSSEITYTTENNEKKHEYIGDELVYVSPNLITNVKFYAGKPLTLNKNEYATLPNYAKSLSFTKYIGYEPEFNSGDKVSITISGRPDKDFSGALKLSINAYDDGNNCYERGSDSYNLNLKADQYFSQTYDIVIRNYAGNLERQDIAITYQTSDFDESLTINEFKLAYDDNPDFEVTKITYHQGYFTFEEYGKTGSEYGLCSNGSLYNAYSRYLEGWYDNTDFIGNAISTVTLENASYDFYGKYALYIRDIKDDSNCSSTDVLFDELWEDSATLIPNKWFDVTLSGKLKKLTDGDFVPVTNKIPLDFHVYETETDNWNAVMNSYDECFEPDENGNFEVTVSVLVPNDFRYVTAELKKYLGVTFGFQNKNYDDELYVFDFTVTAESGRAFEGYTTSDGIVTLKPCEDGIKFIINASSYYEENPSFFVTYFEITENISGTTFKVNNDYISELNNIENDNTIEFVYPLLEPNSLYTFFVNITGSIMVDENTSESKALCYNDVPCLSGNNGFGVIEYDTADFDKLSLLHTEDEDGRYIKIVNDSSKTLDEIIQALFGKFDSILDISDVEVDFSILAGDKKWDGNTAWITGGSNKIPESAFYAGITSSGGLNYMFEGVASYTSYGSMNETFAAAGTVWSDFGYRFQLEDYPAGAFVTKRISSEVTEYTKFEKEYTVTFDSNGGSEVSPQIVKFGGFIDDSTFPTKAGYNFDYWYLDNEDVMYSEYVYSDLTLTAHWTKLEGKSGIVITFPEISTPIDFEIVLKHGETVITSDTKIDGTEDLTFTIPDTIENPVSVKWYIGNNTPAEGYFVVWESSYYQELEGLINISCRVIDSENNEYVSSMKIIITK